MVAVITSGTAIRRTFYYNENKVKEGKGACLMAVNYPMDLPDMNENHRLHMLLKTAALNPDVQRSSMHISLNFAPGEQLSDDLFCRIAKDYMDGIGFGGQPYLVYRHDDAGHPHIHIATVKVRPDGTRINTQNIGRNQSDTTRKALEIKYGLVKAEDHRRQVFALKPVDLERVIYGKTDTRRAIANVIGQVLHTYKYTSVPELNAILNLYNINAGRGSEGSRTYLKGGLNYRLLNDQGEPVGIAVKASSFHNNPGLKFLEGRFLANDLARQVHKGRVKSMIDLLFFRQPGISISGLQQQLKAAGIHMVLRETDGQALYGVTYVDHRTKCVFNGSALGKTYSAKAIQERCGIALETMVKAQDIQLGLPKPTDQFNANNTAVNQPRQSFQEREEHKSNSLLETLFQVEYTGNTVPYEFSAKKKRRKKRKL